jgi:2-oxoglutarate dehydrogenase E2 component (dihydrolipoamide succinyltransferase)
VTPDDVQRAARFAESEVSTKEANPPAQVPRAVPFAGHFSQQLTVVEVDVTAVTALGARFASRFAAASVPSTLTAFLALAAFEALRARPLVSGTAKQQLALVVDTDRGPVTAVLSNAGDLNLLGLSRRISEVAARAHEGSLSVDELGVATLTLADSGSRGVLFDSPVLRDGQPLSLGSGSVVERAVVARGSDGAPVIAIRSMVYLALSHDPSVVDQAGAAGFLAAIKSRLELANFDNEFG